MASQIDIPTARARILAVMATIPRATDCVHTVPVAEAMGHCLARSIVAPIDVPARDVSAMDGYAIAVPDEPDPVSPREYPVVGRSLAGHPYLDELMPGEAVEIATGGWLPATANSVVPFEQCQREGDSVRLEVPLSRGQHLRQQGETFAQGSQVLATGTRLAWHHQAVLATLGISTVAIARPLRVAVFSSGDELWPSTGAGQPQHHDANRPLLLALLQQWGHAAIDGGVLPDDTHAISTRLTQMAREVDVIVTSGGVSRGSHDDIRHALEHHTPMDVWQLAHKPGRAFLFGHVNECVIFGLPGNPLATLACAVQLMLPGLDALAGHQPQDHWQQARLATPVTGRVGRSELLLGRHWQDQQGQQWLAPLPVQNSHRVDMLVQTTCLIELDEHSGALAAGDCLAYFPLVAAGVAS